jgi:hypothetical protein
MLRPKELLLTNDPERMIKEWYLSIDFQWKEVFSYYSSWAILFFFIPFQSRIFQLMRFHMLLHASLGGAYISYLYPRILHVSYMNIILDGFLLQSIDFFAHHLFLIFAMMNNHIPRVCTWIDLWIVNTPMLIYLFNFNIGYRYGLRMIDIMVLFCFYIGLVVFFFFT